MRKVFFVLLYLGLSQAGGQQLSDPTQPKGFIAGNSAAGKESGSSSIIAVSAVIIKSTGNHAVLNGDTVAEGQRWHGYIVEKVHDKGVVLSAQGRETELFINQFSIKKDASNDF
ncbi:hypothetical protein [Aliiglaciecola sp. LCG003]|uniref:hypothetical protein n=1 Tax=Aliiglaciecola sp. LCG003 TaxID=3053655 RepID=UPI002573B3DD|nr:hypothetical protein [Aliiglaciecola sp. LCG003]WJG09702.1 hypothetical protein QR722_01300 [Aliiglaciecola sp. LCG003]